MPSDEALAKLNLMLSSGDYPDVIMGFGNISPAQLQVYGQQGIFVPLNDLIEKAGPNIKKAFRTLSRGKGCQHSQRRQDLRLDRDQRLLPLFNGPEALDL